ncbi:hypothetical protein AURANDRAFT_68292 [Aureococcus anophagefferens]|uniref:Malonyl-CoA:ACP transacylase (MAT) domain-containing protein n=1 Tax=Aureococcus anophagefferens TaxID=44056 RepID=F0YP49_AURAN|nr:hypothetical protein AURANDRAFT_68292 [Aureococcus anophagefferens]EGB03115.1 hypothetical protein AURANDRAFT_68292 [Aureococcus anophagefferens]|eukprot:XP_009042190.1 hypothetical protein AURANDRAFT_68292 [Aureococcus anophagefferens]
MASLAEGVAQVAFFRPIAENNIPHLKKLVNDNAEFDFSSVVESASEWWAEKVVAITGVPPSIGIQGLLQGGNTIDEEVMTQPMLNETIGVLVQVLSVYLHGAWNFTFCVGVSLGHIAAIVVSMSASREEMLTNIPRGLDVLYFIVHGLKEVNSGISLAGVKCMMSVSGKRGSKILNNTIKPILRDFRNVRVGVVWSQNGLLLSGMPEDLTMIEEILLKKKVKFLYTTRIPVSFPMHNEVYNKDLVKLVHKHIDALDCSHFAYNVPILDLSTAEMLEGLEGGALIKRIVGLICSEPNHVPYIEDGVPVGKRLAILDYGCGGMRGGVIGMIQDAMSNMEDDDYELYNYHFDGCKQNILALKTSA